MKVRARRNSGLTLVEVVIASAILVLITLAAFIILISSTKTANNSSIQSGLEARGREFLSTCRNYFYTGQFGNQNVPNLGLYDVNNQMRFQIPVSRDATGAMPYGFTSNIGTNDPNMANVSFCVLRFEANTILRESAGSVPATVNQAATTATVPPLPALPALQTIILNVDANQNGKLTDTFVQGKIKKYVIGPTPGNLAVLTILGSETFADNVILGVDANGNFDGTIDPKAGTAVDPADGDGVYRGDWLFRYVDNNGNTVLGNWPGQLTVGIAVTVWHGSRDESGKGFILRSCKETIRFRNTQQQIKQ
jgi:hypothetical protein